MRVGDGVHGEPVGPRLGGGHGPDAHDLRQAADRSEGADESPDGRGARERDGVHRARAERVRGVARQPPREDRPIGVDALGVPPLRPERFLQAIGCDVGARTQDAALAARERAGEGRDREGPRAQVGVATCPATERLGRSVADGRDRGAHVARTGEPVREHRDRRRRGQHEPVVAAGGQVAQRGRKGRAANGAQGDRRGDDRSRPPLVKELDQSHAPLGRSRDEDGLARER